jgi:hypothetical protein
VTGVAAAGVGAETVGVPVPEAEELVTVVMVVVVVVVVMVLVTPVAGAWASASPTAVAKGGAPGTTGAPTANAACLPASTVTVPEAFTDPSFFLVSILSSEGGMFSKSLALLVGITPTDSPSRTAVTSSSVKFVILSEPSCEA